MNPGTASPIISTKAVGLVVGLCMVGAFVFIPDKEELVSRLDKDGHVDRLKALANEVLELSTPATQPQTDAEKMRAWITSPNAELRDDPAVVAEKKIMCAITDTPEAVGAEVIAGAGKLDEDLFGELMDGLARRALGLQHQAEAGWLLAQWNQRQPSWELVMRSVQAWRWAVKSGDALKTIDAGLALGLKAREAPENIDELRLKLAMESNQPNLAFDLIAARYRKAPAKDKPALLHRVLELANAGDRTAEASQLIVEHLDSLPFHRASLDEAIQMVASGHIFENGQEEADYREYATSFAHWQEWANHGDKAIDTWFRLSLIGSNEAWERALDLYEDVLRGDDFMKVLSYRISRGISLDKQMLLADLLVERGDIDEAVKAYQNAAVHLAQPTAAHRALARIYQQQGEWAQAEKSFSDVLSAVPNDLEAAKGVAFALVRQHRYDEACDAYVALATAHPEDAEAQEITAGLCESLGRNADALTATQRLLACPGRESTTEEYLELADEFRLAGDSTGSIKALREGFDHFPASIRLRLTLADALSHDGSHDEAVRLLAYESLRNNPGAMDLLISEAVEATNAAVAVEFFGGQPPACLRDLPLSNLRLAFLLDRTGRRLESEKIIASILQDVRLLKTETWMDLGSTCLSVGDDVHAESFVEHFIESGNDRNAKAWELLGDIYQSQERIDEAVKAYRRAVDLIGPRGIGKDGVEHSSVKVSQNDPSGR